MASNTEHYNLVKPDYADAADVAQLNENMDIIDSILWQLANAGADEELLKKVQEILDKIGETDDTGGSEVSGTLMAKANKIISDTSVQTNKLDTLLTILGSGVAEFTNPGVYEVEIPAGITKIKVTAAAGGGAGCSLFQYQAGNYNFGSAGSGGCSIVDKEFELPNTGSVTKIQVTVGAGGNSHLTNSTAATAIQGSDGQPTIIGNLITLAGGKAGKAYGNSGLTTGTFTSTTTQSAGEGSGNGGASKAHRIFGSQDGFASVTGNTGTAGSLGQAGTAGKAETTGVMYNNYYLLIGGGSGGGSLGNGGSAPTEIQNVSDPDVLIPGVSPTRGGGGYAAGGAIYCNPNNYGSHAKEGCSGANGYAKIEWGF